MKRLTNEEFINKLKNIGSSLIPLEEYKGTHIKIKFQCSKGHIFNYEPNSILTKRTGCPICSNHRVLQGYNDIWTTNPSMAKLLLNPDDGYKYTENSTHKLNWKCSDCGNIIKSKSPNTIYRQGLCCPVCNDGISYSEKYIISFLNQLDIEFEHDVSLSWSNGKRYDFYIDSLNLIIETHGLQHYEERFNNFNYTKKNNRSLLEEQENDKYKRQLALNNGVKYYIQLDCRESKSEYIKKSISDSKLSEIFNLSQIDWNKCSIDSAKSLIYHVANCWNEGIYDVIKMAEMFHLHKGTIIDYLKKATEIGLCIYDKSLTKQEGANKIRIARRKSVRCIETGKIYMSILDVEKDGFSSKHVSSVCKGDRQTTGGCHWEYV